MLYSIFLLICIIAGTALIVGNFLLPLGIALIAGSVFAGGSFVSQVWSLTVQGERKAYELAFGDELKEHLRGMLEEIAEVEEAIAQIERGLPDEY